MNKRPENSPGVYSNFTALDGFTFCAEGDVITLPDGSGHQDYIPACMVYTAAPYQDASRIRLTDGTYHRKVTLDGSRGEESLYGNIPEIQQALAYLYLANQTLDSRIIAVPTSDIARVYDPRESLEDLLFDKVPRIPEAVVGKVRKSVAYMVRQGFPLSDIGIYGGLQTFVIHKDSQKDQVIKDVDLVIFGTEHAREVKRLALQNQRFNMGEMKTRVSHVDEEIRRRRHSLTRIHIPYDDDGLFCDIKIVRKDTDKSIIKEVKQLPQDIIVEGVVANAQEALSSPAAFTLVTRDQGVVTVSSSKYNFIGAVTEGDIVRIKAALTDVNNYLLMTNPKAHSITYISKSTNVL